MQSNKKTTGTMMKGLPRAPPSPVKRNTSNSSSKVSGEEHKIHFRSALASIHVPRRLLAGVPIFIVAASGKTTPAVLSISVDRFTAYIRADPSSTKSTSSLLSFVSKSRNDDTLVDRAVDIGEMDRIQRGQSTQQFEFAKKNTRNNNPLERSSVEVVLNKNDLRRNYSSGGASTASSRTTYSEMSIMIQQLDPSLSFSIIFRGAHTVDLMARTVQERDAICDTLDAILLAYQRGKICVSTDVLLLRYVFLDVDKEKTGYVNVSQIGKILQAINFNMKQKDVVSNYEQFGKVIGMDRAQRRKGLTFEQAATFLHKTKRDSWIVKPINVLWNDLFGEVMNNRKMRTTVSDKTFLEQFLHKKQGQTRATLVDVQNIFRRLHEMEFAFTSSQAQPLDPSRISKDQFEAYLRASENDAFNPEKEQLNEKNMNLPICQYFCNSSHNTYLIGDQYKSASSVEMYSNALYRGARCLELDIWDGGKTNGGTPIPVVWHGGTLTTKINFVDIIKTIKVFLNFHPDTYPIILSFENHCSIPYQQVIATQLTEVLGDSLYVPTEASLFGDLPSPNSLRGMVVIKGRRPDGTEADQYDTDDESDTEEGASTNLGDIFVTETEQARAKVVKHGVAPELASLTLFHGHKLKTFEESQRTFTYYMHSFSESKVRSHCRHGLAVPWTKYNQRHMSRTYPAGSRLDSSNYNPMLAWSVGCQMVALNFQTQDAYLRLNDGRFRENGNCGYVLKPSALLLKESLGQSSNPILLTVKVLSGNCLPKPKGLRSGDCIDPYVKATVYDVANRDKETIVSHMTGVAIANGFFPIWGQEEFSFTVESWSVAILQLTVYDKLKEEFIASASIPVSCLRRGIRCVKLYDATNTRSGAFDFASLLMDIKFGVMTAEI